MATDSGIHRFVLQELRLRDTADAGDAARAVAAARSGGSAPVIPLLTSIEDERDVAFVRAVYGSEAPPTDAEQRVVLERFAATWQSPRRYVPRITEGTAAVPTHYRLAVTSSGINDAEHGPVVVTNARADDDCERTPLEMLWIGVPLGTYAGLFILLGTAGDGERPAAGEWPLPLSRYLGVRIYDSRR